MVNSGNVAHGFQRILRLSYHSRAYIKEMAASRSFLAIARLSSF